MKDIAEYLGVDDKTVRSYLAEFKSNYKLERGIVTRITDEDTNGKRE